MLALSNCRILLLFLLIFILALSGADVPRPRGVPLFKASLYAPRADKTWVCLDNEKTIKQVQINDDYCDCADGSDEPGTSACANGHFNCANIGHRAEDITSSRVNDGICDCCDGSDEWADGAGKCQNICLELGRVEEEQRRQKAELHKHGNTKRSEMITRGKQMRAEREGRRKVLARRQSEQEAIKAEKEELKRNAETAEAGALEFYKEQQREKDAAEAEARRLQEDRETMRNEAEAAFVKYDVNKDGFVEVAELMVDITLDRDRNGIVTVEEAKYFIDERDRIDLESFYTLAWPRIKPIKMLAEGIFKPPIPEGDVEQVQYENREDHQSEPVEEREQYAYEDGQEHDGTEPEDIHDEVEEHDEELDADVGVGSVADASRSEIEYDPETKHLIDLANEARHAYSEAEQKVREIENEIKEIDQQSAKDYGPNEEFAALDGECFTYEDREYVYTFCPYERATQKQRSGGAETTLGRWDQWIDEGVKKYTKQKYAHGAACWNGPQRSTIVQFVCGLEHKITAVTEPNRCEYNYLFETPAVCDGNVSSEKPQRDEL
ncbi:glucosidase 2 subunit beta-like [Eurosta solidaginis]|uniref:glucosidase 2 subunit beta-like n=1 Tax=Eurosta solidaginis TaxID=178769 RepID=UPI003530575B